MGRSGSRCACCKAKIIVVLFPVGACADGQKLVPFLIARPKRDLPTLGCCSIGRVALPDPRENRKRAFGGHDVAFGR